MAILRPSTETSAKMALDARDEKAEIIWKYQLNGDERESVCQAFRARRPRDFANLMKVPIGPESPNDPAVKAYVSFRNEEVMRQFAHRYPTEPESAMDKFDEQFSGGTK